MPQAILGPEFPVALLAVLLPRPKSSWFLCSTIVRPIIPDGPYLY